MHHQSCLETSCLTKVNTREGGMGEEKRREGGGKERGKGGVREEERVGREGRRGKGGGEREEGRGRERGRERRSDEGGGVSGQDVAEEQLIMSPIR